MSEGERKIDDEREGEKEREVGCSGSLAKQIIHTQTTPFQYRAELRDKRRARCLSPFCFRFCHIRTLPVLLFLLLQCASLCLQSAPLARLNSLPVSSFNRYLTLFVFAVLSHSDLPNSASTSNWKSHAAVIVIIFTLVVSHKFSPQKKISFIKSFHAFSAFVVTSKRNLEIVAITLAMNDAKFSENSSMSNNTAECSIKKGKNKSNRPVNAMVYNTMPWFMVYRRIGERKVRQQVRVSR